MEVSHSPEKERKKEDERSPLVCQPKSVKIGLGMWSEESLNLGRDETLLQ